MADYQKHKNNKIRAGLVVLGLLCLSIGLIGQYQTNALTTSASVGGRELPIYCVDTDEKKVALSFDAAWGNEDTARILEILKKNDVHVTFFMTGGWVESYPDDVKAIYEAGHDLGNHSENHKNMSQLSVEECKSELQQVHERSKRSPAMICFCSVRLMAIMTMRSSRRRVRWAITPSNGMLTVWIGKITGYLPSCRQSQSTSIWEMDPLS